MIRVIILCLAILCISADNTDVGDDECIFGKDSNCPPSVCQAKECEKNFVVMFSASWCPPCKKMYPVIDELKKQGYICYTYMLDSEEYKDLSAKYNVYAYPTFSIFEGGKEVKRTLGITNIEWFKKNLKLRKNQTVPDENLYYLGV